jgi:hypothetical protein
MKLVYFFTLLLITCLCFIGGNTVNAATKTVSIKSENTVIESKNRIIVLKEILYSTAMNFDYARLAIVID